MADLLKIIGVIVVVAAGAAMALIERSDGLIGALALLPALAGGAAVYGLGDIMNNIAAIKRASERQAAAMEEMSRQNAPRPR